MKNSTISEKEFEVIRCIGENNHFNQRLIAQHAGISLGLTNLLINRLVKKGHLKLRQLTPKKIQYILTPKGMTEKVRKSYHFTMRTIDTLRAMKRRTQELVMEEYRRGVRSFAIYGKGELANLVEIAIRDLSLEDISFSILHNIDDINDNNMTILAAEDNQTIALPYKGIKRTLKNHKKVINIMGILVNTKQ